MKNILLLGASGSIGQQTLDVMSQQRENFRLIGFSVGEKTDLISQIISKHPDVRYLCVKHKTFVSLLKKQYPKIKIFFGDVGLIKIVEVAQYDLLVNALVGFVGFPPTIAGLKKRKTICLANKESLVVGGEIINSLIKRGYGLIYPIDSEHVALQKCLNKTQPSNVRKLILTASGGAFRHYTIPELKNVNASDALKHPTWQMGPKITIDSATMMNKGFEIIEAYYLFGFELSQIDILMHDESHVHSLVELNDGTLLADISKPDMRVPIEYALSCGNSPYEIQRAKTLADFKDFHFHDFKDDKYPCVALAKNALKKGGTTLAVLNAVNEVAVYAFLDNKIAFLDIHKYIAQFVEKANVKKQTLRNVKTADYKTRKQARKLIGI